MNEFDILEELKKEEPVRFSTDRRTQLKALALYLSEKFKDLKHVVDKAAELDDIADVLAFQRILNGEIDFIQYPNMLHYRIELITMGNVEAKDLVEFVKVYDQYKYILDAVFNQFKDYAPGDVTFGAETTVVKAPFTPEHKEYRLWFDKLPKTELDDRIIQMFKLLNDGDKLIVKTNQDVLKRMRVLLADQEFFDALDADLTYINDELGDTIVISRYKHEYDVDNSDQEATYTLEV